MFEIKSRGDLMTTGLVGLDARGVNVCWDNNWTV